MKKNFTFIILIFLVSCKQEKITRIKNFEENIVDFVIEQKNNREIELKDLYDSLTRKIPDERNEKSIIVQILKRKGFKITNWGRGNFANGPRVIIYNLENKNCECEVSKYYYSTTDSITYLRTETISCK